MSTRIGKLRLEVLRRRRARNRRPAVVALDAMGTDHGPETILRGAFEAVELYPAITVVATGPSGQLHSILRRNGWEHPRLLVENATEVVEMGESPKESLKKESSSVGVAARLVAEGRAAGLVSAGNTGATMANALRRWKRLPGISRPGVVAFMPQPGNPCILLDVGANVDCRPQHLLDFAIMGVTYAHYVFGRRNPSLGILSIGEEETKGNELVLETRELLVNSGLHFLGNAEGRDLFKGRFDVVVCDGFVGNVVLKTGEGIVRFITDHLKSEVRSSVMSQVGALAMSGVFRTFKKQVDATEFGGAPLLGLNGACIICHGSAEHVAIRNALRVAGDHIAADLNRHIMDLAKRVHEKPLPGDDAQG